MPHRPHIVYLLSHEVSIDTLEYVVHLITHVHTLPYRITVVTQSSRVYPQLTAVSQLDSVDIVTLQIPDDASFLFRLRVLIAFLREKPPTLVHCLATSPDTDTESIIAMWLAQIPWRIVTFAHVPVSLKSDGIRPLYHTMMKRLLRTLHSIIVYTNNAKQQLQQNFAITMTPIHVIPIGIDSQRYALHTIPHASRRELRLPDAGRIIGSIGPYTTSKGYATLIHSMDNVWQQNPDCHLVLVGQGEDEPYLRQLAQKSAQPNQIHFLIREIYQDNADVLPVIDIYVQPSFAEAMSFNLLIAMAMERPIVASNITNIQEIIDSNASGLLVRPGDPNALATAINRMLNDPSIRITTALNARSRVSQRFLIETWQHATAACYHFV
ncbi:MAG: glycosyltransferase family 4 protein [Chloroflexota bacterium]|jgi:glycosyltransferase involved in cell wall biosynthesis